MKLAQVSLALLACAASASAQYFSEGWAPGKPVTQDPPRAAATPVANAGPPVVQQQGGLAGLKSMFDLGKLLESGPVSSLFSRAGINITEQLEVARAKVAPNWDPRIPFITDDNYDELIVRESLTEEEKEKRSWFIVVTAQSTGRGGNSKQLDESFDSAYNTTIIQGDLPDIRWARIDYLNVTYLTTKWNIWQAPYIMLIREQGQTIYFYQATHVRLTAEVLRDFLKDETWKTTTPWKTVLGPGGDYEYVMHYFALSLQYMYNAMVILPRWVLMLVTGGIASLIMRIMHRDPEPTPPKPAAEKVEDKPAAPAPAEKEASGSTTSTPTKKSAKSRKGGKK